MNQIWAKKHTTIHVPPILAGVIPVDDYASEFGFKTLYNKVDNLSFKQSKIKEIRHILLLTLKGVSFEF